MGNKPNVNPRADENANFFGSVPLKTAKMMMTRGKSGSKNINKRHSIELGTN